MLQESPCDPEDSSTRHIRCEYDMCEAIAQGGWQLQHTGKNKTHLKVSLRYDESQ